MKHFNAVLFSCTRSRWKAKLSWTCATKFSILEVKSVLGRCGLELHGLPPCVCIYNPTFTVWCLTYDAVSESFLIVREIHWFTIEQDLSEVQKNVLCVAFTTATIKLIGVLNTKVWSKWMGVESLVADRCSLYLQIIKVMIYCCSMKFCSTLLVGC